MMLQSQAAFADSDIYEVKNPKGVFFSGDTEKNDTDKDRAKGRDRVPVTGEATYKKIKFKPGSTANVEVWKTTLNLLGDNGGFIDGSDDVELKVSTGGEIHLGQDSARATMKAKTLEAVFGGELYLNNAEVTVAEEVTAGASVAMKNSSLTSDIFTMEDEVKVEKSTLSVRNFESDDTSTLTLTDSKANIENFKGGEAEITRSTLVNPIQKTTLTDASGQSHEVYLYDAYSATYGKKAGFKKLSVTDSDMQLAVTNLDNGEITLSATKDALHSSKLLMYANGTQASGAVINNGFQNINYTIGDNTTMAIAGFAFTKGDYLTMKTGGSAIMFGLEADYADAATVQKRIDEAVTDVKGRSKANPKAILYASFPLRLQAGTNQITVGSGAQGAPNTLTFGNSSLFIVDMDVPGSNWKLDGKKDDPILSNWDQSGSKVTLSVADGALLYVKGLKQETEEIHLIGKQVEAKSKWNLANIYTENPLYGFKYDASGNNLLAQLQKSSVVFGKYLRAGKMFDKAADKSDPTQKWLSSLMNSLGQGKSFSSMSPAELARLGAAADGMLSPAGAAGVYSSAFDLAVEMVESVQANAGTVKETGTHVWAKVLGGKTTIDELPATGSKMSLKRDAYGIAIGADHLVAQGLRVGVAANYSTGTTKNQAVGIKDDFDAWGLTAYSRYGVGPFTLDGHAGVTWLKSDLKNDWMSNKVAVDTKVYNAGLRGSVGVLLGETIFYPFVGVEAYHLRGEGYDVASGIQAQVDATSSVLQFPVGFQWAGHYQTRYGVLAPSFALTYARNVGDRDIAASTSALGETVAYDFTYAGRHSVTAELGLGLQGENYEYGLKAGYVEGSEDRQAYKFSANAAYRF